MHLDLHMKLLIYRQSGFESEREQEECAKEGHIYTSATGCRWFGRVIYGWQSAASSSAAETCIEKCFAQARSRREDHDVLSQACVWSENQQPITGIVRLATRWPISIPFLCIYIGEGREGEKCHRTYGPIPTVTAIRATSETTGIREVVHCKSCRDCSWVSRHFIVTWAIPNYFEYIFRPSPREAIQPFTIHQKSQSMITKLEGDRWRSWSTPA